MAEHTVAMLLAAGLMSHCANCSRLYPVTKGWCRTCKAEFTRTWESEFCQSCIVGASLNTRPGLLVAKLRASLDRCAWHIGDKESD